jgi:tetratricopeptide (TPR) repeat protein/tRNA A-37 threonylcarbamoyl transferase component Bud32/TolB-like protein
MADSSDEGPADRPQGMATRSEASPQPGATAGEPPRFVPGTLLAGRFRIVRFVAGGGMGEVYEAEDLELDERVALKTIRRELAGDPRALDRFKTEIHLARKVTHPNVCRIYDVFHEPGQGGDGETVFLTMELLRGQTLAEHLQSRGRLGLPEALPLVRQVAQALEAAHRAGVIHRDFKSSNVVLVPAPQEAQGVRAVVTDFGLARMTAPSEASRAWETPTLTQQLVGTPAYMAPEQIEGAPVTAAVDVYALGVVMYEMATGQRPFSGDTPVAAMLKRLKEAPPSPRHVVKDVDPRWEAVILRCLERTPGDRFASAEDVGRALAGEEVIPSRRRLERRRRLWLGLAAAALTVAGASYVWFARPTATPGGPGASAPPPGATTPRRSVAVLGLKSLSGRAESAWLSTALAEMLGSELAAGEMLRTVPGESVARMKQELALSDTDALAADTLTRVRRALGADLLVIGSYTALGGAAGKIRLDLRLQDAVAGETVGSVSETGTEGELFDLVSRTGARLREKLGVAPLTAAEAGGVRAALPVHPEAARLYAEGLARLRLFDALGARRLLEQALTFDPGHALTHSALSSAWTVLGYDGRAREEAKKAFDLSASLSREDRLAIEARHAEATMQWDQAIETYRSLHRFYPDSLEYGLRLAGALGSADKGKEALATYDELRKLPPPAGADPRIDLAEAQTARFLSETQRAVAAARRAAEKAEAQGTRHLLARARFEEGSALQNLGEYDQAQAALQAARNMFSEAGDRRGVAGSLNNLALIAANRGDLEGAGRMAEEALAHYRAIGSKSGEALMLGNQANFLYFRGELKKAIEGWERTLVTYREINDKSGMARMLTNVASAVAEQGEVAAARARQEEALALWREVGQKSGIATTLQNIGRSWFLEGDLARAEAASGEAVGILEQIGDKTYLASALYEYGDLLLAKGDLAGARLRYQQALDLQEGMSEKVPAALSRLALANVGLEEGQAEKAAADAARAATFFEGEKEAEGEIRARLLLARSLGVLGRNTEAAQAVARAKVLASRSEFRPLRFAVAVEEARVRAASDRAAARALAESVARQKVPVISFALHLEAEMLLCEIRLGGDAGAKDALRELEAQARDKGFSLLARKAALARR